jgi:LuxR family maltose regulon positive regulatory protein
MQDYVLREVFAAEAPELIEALLDFAVVKRANHSLARALTNRLDAGELLQRAEARGLFVTHLDPEGWFEIHPLVRTVLTAELASRSPSRLAEQHVRAARWFEEAHEVPLALEHWLHAGRPRDALRLLAAEHAELYDSGREATIERTIAAIGPEVAAADLESVIEFAWCHLLVSRARFLELVDQACWMANQAAPDSTLRARLTMLQSITATLRGGWAEGGALARRALTDLGEGYCRDPVGRIGWNMVAREIALAERWDDGGDEVREAELAVWRDARRQLALEGTRAVGEALAGRPIDALRTAAGVRHAASVSNITILRAELAFAEALAHREVGDRPRALIELRALSEAPAETMLYIRVLACLELAHAHLDDGDLDAARRAFSQAESIIEGEFFGPDGQDWFARTAVRLALAAGDNEDAQRLSREINDPFWRSVSTARSELAAGIRGDALTALKTAAPRCPRHEVVLALVKARALDDHEESLKCATVAVERAAAVGMLQTVASEGPDVNELVERAAWRVPPDWVDRFRRAAGSAGSRTRHGHPVEPLTERERDVLRFLPSRLTIREIADELFVSVNTLKFHLKVIYRKLGVSSREEASNAARRMAHMPRERSEF